MNRNNDDNLPELDPNDVESVVKYAVGDLLDIAAGVAELQGTKQGADDIWAMCDLIAEYFQIERTMMIRREDEESGETTVESVTFTGTNPYADYYTDPDEVPQLPGLKIRVIDADSDPKDSS
jgi:hypothetical protein